MTQTAAWTDGIKWKDTRRRISFKLQPQAYIPLFTARPMLQPKVRGNTHHTQTYLTLSFRSKREYTKWWVGCRYRQRKTRIISSLLLRCIRFWRIRMSITPHHSTSLKQAAKIPSVEEYLLPFGKRKCSLVPLAKQARGAKSLISSYLSRLDRSSLTDDLHGGCAQQRRR